MLAGELVEKDHKNADSWHFIFRADHIDYSINGRDGYEAVSFQWLFVHGCDTFLPIFPGSGACVMTSSHAGVMEGGEGQGNKQGSVIGYFFEISKRGG